MGIINRLTHLKKLHVIFDGFLVLFDIVVQNANWIVWSALISDFSCSSASKCQHFVIFESSHCAYVNAVVNFFGCRHDWYMFALSLVQAWFLFKVAWWGIEEKGKLNSMGLGWGHGLVVSWSVKVFNVVLFGQWTSNSERFVHWWLVHTVASWFSRTHW